MMRYFSLTLAALLIFAGMASGQQDASTNKGDAKGRDDSGKRRDTGIRASKGTVPVSLPDFTPERETAALDFVQRNHPKLAGLLTGYLKAHDKKEYQREIRKLFRASDRLAQIKKRGDAKRHAIELKTWKVDSKIRLLAAQLSMDRQNDSLRGLLHKLLVQKNGLQLKRFELDRERVKQRLERLDITIKKYKSNPNDRADKALKKILASTSKPKRGVRPRRKTAVTKKDGGPTPRKPSRNP